MVSFSAVLNDARQLSERERLELIDALWDTVPSDADLPLHDDWGPELQRRVDAIKSGMAETVPWNEIRAAALAQIANESAD